MFTSKDKESCHHLLFIAVIFPPFLQSTPQIKAQLPSSATACYALAVSADGKVTLHTYMYCTYSDCLLYCCVLDLLQFSNILLYI